MINTTAQYIAAVHRKLILHLVFNRTRFEGKYKAKWTERIGQACKIEDDSIRGRGGEEEEGAKYSRRVRKNTEERWKKCWKEAKDEQRKQVNFNKEKLLK